MYCEIITLTDEQLEEMQVSTLDNESVALHMMYYDYGRENEYDDMLYESLPNTCVGDVWRYGAYYLYRDFFGNNTLYRKVMKEL